MSVRLADISKSYNSTTALKNLSLEVENGKTTILIGQAAVENQLLSG